MNTTSPYKFKTAFPSKNMQKALLLWVRKKNVLEDKVVQQGLKGRYTREFLRNKTRRTELVISIGVGIKRHGIKATNFKQVSVDAIMDDMKKELAEAMASDIIININTSFLK